LSAAGGLKYNRPTGFGGSPMTIHSHRFVETINGFLGFGYDRETDEKTIMYYLQKFSDDRHLETIIPRLTDDELNQLFEMLSNLMKNHLSNNEYHHLFLKDRSDWGEWTPPQQATGYKSEVILTPQEGRGIKSPPLEGLPASWQASKMGLGLSNIASGLAGTAVIAGLAKIIIKSRMFRSCRYLANRQGFGFFRHRLSAAFGRAVFQRIWFSSTNFTVKNTFVVHSILLRS
jgi:hypothetical protein